MAEARVQPVPCVWRLSMRGLSQTRMPKALASTHKILRTRGQIIILDLLKHQFEKAHELYGDRWLGFAESDLHRWLEAAGFINVSRQPIFGGVVQLYQGTKAC